ncbi:MAG: SRPBCC family protein [Alphaproteobacteria bacterium]
MAEALIAVAGLGALALAALLAYAATRPDSFRIERRAFIAAPPEAIFPHINGFRTWAAWSPWEGKDPAMRREYGTRTAGVDASYAWAGNRLVGEGRMEIVESVPPTRIVIRLTFLKPFKARNTAEFTLTPQPGGTEVTWAMHGPSPYLSKLMGVVCNMDRMVGKEFETGLGNLKRVVEGR